MGLWGARRLHRGAKSEFSRNLIVCVTWLDLSKKTRLSTIHISEEARDIGNHDSARPKSVGGMKLSGGLVEKCVKAALLTLSSS